MSTAIKIFSINLFCFSLFLLSQHYLDNIVFSINIEQKLLYPSWNYLWGTDQLGRSWLLMNIKAFINSLFLVTILVSSGAILGSYFGGMLILQNKLIQKLCLNFVHFLYILPLIVISAFIIAHIENRLYAIAFPLFLHNFCIFFKLSYTNATMTRRFEFVKAAYALGKKNREIYHSHILPQFFPLAMTHFGTQLALGFMIEGGLSYLGLGFAAPEVSLGLLIFESQNYIYTHLFLVFLPCLLMMLLIGVALFFTQRQE